MKKETIIFERKKVSLLPQYYSLKIRKIKVELVKKELIND